MRITTPNLFSRTRTKHLPPTRHLSTSPPPILSIQNATFYLHHPSLSSPSSPPNPPFFPNLTLTLPSLSSPHQTWAILSPSSIIRTLFLQILRGQHLCFPPTARSHPYLTSRHQVPDTAISYVGFNGERQRFGGAYLSARYESRVEETDFSLRMYLTGIEGLNPGEEVVRERTPERGVLERVVKDLELERFLESPVSLLSNGQSRRARIGRALLAGGGRGTEMLCLDAPFIGLDPFVSKHISSVLQRLAEANAPRIVLSLRPQDVIPEWITHIVYAGEDGKVDALGPKEEVFRYLKQQYEDIEQSPVSRQNPEHDLDPKLVEIREVGRHLSEKGDFEADPTEPQTTSIPILSRDGYPQTDTSTTPLGAPVVEMEGVNIKYGSTSVLGNWTQSTTSSGNPTSGLWWTVRQGQRWGIFGPNGSGKTTLLSLVTSDHPQTYSAPVRIFQRSRLPTPGEPGITIFDIQARMGHSSPEVHALFPKNLSVRRTLESAWSDTPIMKPKLDGEAGRRVDACLSWFKAELNPNPPSNSAALSPSIEVKLGNGNLDWATNILFGELSFSSQRVLLFLRATIRNPEIVILDEAFSGMDDLVRDKCLLFLSRGETMRLHYHETGPRPVEVDVEMGAGNGDRVAIRGLMEHQALLVVSHSRQEVPGCVREWICLPEAGMGTPPRMGRWDGPVELSARRWSEVWGLEGESSPG
ncbi:hypothetical protein BCR34DRAFT_553979 [Clohesyomyces aquaticus]|uniref:ABC transporter domain-containing protein n=1 Tax=Clohesyomyces aquaticus TaxID=1231657 RepID=A0A1Y2A707_9PLEO|nr:hypothetical protein BCR34DRAFT_553979 [Clohesyomyces aquaticus]